MRRTQLAGLRPVPKYSLVCSAEMASVAANIGTSTWPPGAAGAHPREQRGDAVGRVQARREVGQRHAGLDRRAVGLAGHAHHAGGGLDRQVEAAFLPRGPSWPIGRDRAVHQRRLARAEPVPAQAQALHRAGAAVLEQHVGVRTSARAVARSAGFFRSSASERLPRLMLAKFSLKPPVSGGHCAWRRPRAARS
jgi:hypothetical protein